MSALRSKTLWFALLLAVLGAVEAYAGFVRGVLLPLMGENWTGFTLIGISVAVSILRVYTSLPLSKK